MSAAWLDGEVVVTYRGAKNLHEFIESRPSLCIRGVHELLGLRFRHERSHRCGSSGISKGDVELYSGILSPSSQLIGSTNATRNTKLVTEELKLKCMHRYLL